MRKSVNNLLAICGLLTALCVTPLVQAQQGVEDVETESLLEFPHRYWAKRVIFKDKLTELPDKDRIKIKGNFYYAAKAAALTTVYLTQEALEEFDSENALNRDFIFRGTVLNKGSLVGRDRFYYIIEKVIQRIDPTEDIEGALEGLVEAPAGEFESEVRRMMGELLYSVQGASLVYTSENGISFEEIYDPNSPHHAKLLDITRAVIRPIEREGVMPPSEIVSQLIASALTTHYRPELEEAMPKTASGFSPVKEKTLPQLDDYRPTSVAERSANADMMDKDMGNDEDLPMADTPMEKETMVDVPDSKESLRVLKDSPEPIVSPTADPKPAMAEKTATPSPAVSDSLHKDTQKLLQSLEEDSLEEPEPLELDLDFDF